MFNILDFNRMHRGSGVSVVNARGLEGGYDPGLARPYLDERTGKIWVDVTTDYKPRYDANNNYVMNHGQVVYDRVIEPQLMVDRIRNGLPCVQVDNATVLRKDQWIAIDQQVGMAIRKRLRFYADMRALRTNTLDGMSLGTLEREIMSDNGEALVSMDGIAEGRNAQSVIGLESIPLPITYSDFWLSDRFLQISRNRGQGLDNSRGEQAGRRCGELVEKTSIGITTGITWGTTATHLHNSTVYGLTNHPDRITYTSLTASATITTNIATTGPKTFVSNVMALIDAAVAQNFFGPYVLYLSTDYHDLIKQDYLISGSLSDRTIMSRIKEIDTIQDVRRLDYLTGDVMILVQMDGEYMEAVNGMEFRTIQYDTKGGMQKNFKVLGIQLVRFKPEYVSDPENALTTKIPVVHGTTS